MIERLFLLCLFCIFHFTNATSPCVDFLEGCSISVCNDKWLGSQCAATCGACFSEPFLNARPTYRNYNSYDPYNNGYKRHSRSSPYSSSPRTSYRSDPRSSQPAPRSSIPRSSSQNRRPTSNNRRPASNSRSANSRRPASNSRRPASNKHNQPTTYGHSAYGGNNNNGYNGYGNGGYSAYGYPNYYGLDFESDISDIYEDGYYNWEKVYDKLDMDDWFDGDYYDDDFMKAYSNAAAYNNGRTSSFSSSPASSSNTRNNAPNRGGASKTPPSSQSPQSYGGYSNDFYGYGTPNYYNYKYYDDWWDSFDDSGVGTRDCRTQQPENCHGQTEQGYCLFDSYGSEFNGLSKPSCVECKSSDAKCLCTRYDREHGKQFCIRDEICDWSIKHDRCMADYEVNEGDKAQSNGRRGSFVHNCPSILEKEKCFGMTDGLKRCVWSGALGFCNTISMAQWADGLCGIHASQKRCLQESRHDVNCMWSGEECLKDSAPELPMTVPGVMKRATQFVVDAIPTPQPYMKTLPSFIPQLFNPTLSPFKNEIKFTYTIPNHQEPTLRRIKKTQDSNGHVYWTEAFALPQLVKSLGEAQYSALNSILIAIFLFSLTGGIYLVYYNRNTKQVANKENIVNLLEEENIVME